MSLFTLNTILSKDLHPMESIIAVFFVVDIYNTNGGLQFHWIAKHLSELLNSKWTQICSELIDCNRHNVKVDEVL